jgi:monoamine oxidase
MLSLIDEFGLQKIDCIKDTADNRLVRHAYFLDGRFYNNDEVIQAFKKFILAIEQDKLKIEKEDFIGLKSLDEMGIDQYLQHLGISGWFYKLLICAFTSEFGLEASEQSALNFISTVGMVTVQFEVFGDSDERYTIAGGGEKLISKLTGLVTPHLEKSHKLIALDKHDDIYSLKFENGKSIEAKYVLLSLPFSVLRKVDIRFALPAKKRKAIDELGYGTNGKVLLGFKQATWRTQGYSGYVFNETLQNGWQGRQEENANGSCSYTVFMGGNAGANLQAGREQEFLSQLNKIFPGCLDVHNGKAFCFNWTKNENNLGSYACYKKGQWLSIAGSEFEPLDNLHFAGEHCSEAFQGFMNGGAETGRRAAEAIIAKVKLPQTAT